jgi:DmsE family decaheme c-type cytochrome
MRSLPFWLRPRIAVPLLCFAVLATLASWSVALSVPVAVDPASPRSAAQHIADMRTALTAIHRGKVGAATLAAIADLGADLVAIHRGKVDRATLLRIAARNSMEPPGGIIPASFSREDVAGEISRYIAQPDTGDASPDSQPARERPHRSRTASSVAPPGSAEAPAAADASSDSRTYVGQKTCESCHQQEAANWAHTIHAAVFTLNPRDENESRGCEACHGPGSAHVANPSDLSTIISFSHKSLTPIAAQNARCLSCHQGGARIFWHGSIHEDNKLACSDCHNPMTNFAARGLTARESINETCFSCHKVQRTQFNMRSHMPLPEGKITCVDCHNPHGSTTDPLLKADSVNEVCYGCHAEKRGPFLFEHAPVRENCLNCHNPHGSNFESLLTAPRPMLCQQCHAQDGHPAQLLTRGNLPGGPMPDPRLISTSCQTCHVNIHGSNDPSGARFER